MLLILHARDRAEVVRAGGRCVGDAHQHARFENGDREIYILAVARIAAPCYRRATYGGKRAAKSVRQHVIRYEWTSPSAEDRLRETRRHVTGACRALRQ